MIAGMRALRAAEQIVAALFSLLACFVLLFAGIEMIDHEVSTISVSGWDNDAC
jgi:hypothetical protein